MKYARVSRPGAPSGGLTAGIDWARRRDLAACRMHAARRS
jgi:hypothetical protein